MSDYLEEPFELSQSELEDLIKKGLVKQIGYDPNGRPVFTNTDLGNEVANLIEEEENERRSRRRTL